jgi:hypothetical protein
MDKAEAEAFLPQLGASANVSSSTQGQGLSASVFLYEEVPAFGLLWRDNVTRAKRLQRLPAVLNRG